MSKINKKSINYSLKILAVLAFSLLMIPAKVSAEGGTNYVYRSPNYYYPNTQYVPTPTPPPVVYSNSGTKNTTTKTTTNTSNTASPTTATPATNPNDNGNTGSNLAANAVYGSGNSFMPSGLIQWILFAIFIILLVILVRKIFGAKENYDESPMKHA